MQLHRCPVEDILWLIILITNVTLKQARHRSKFFMLYFTVRA